MRHRLSWLSLLCLLCAAAPAVAQPRPGAFTTIVATDTTPTAICVGCPVASTAPAANSGLIAATVTLTNGAPAITTNKLYQVGGSLFFNGIGLASGSSVAGTVGKVAKFLTINSLGDSLLSEAGTAVTIGGTTLTATGVLTATGFGTHAFTTGGTGLQTLAVRNTTAGTGNATRLLLGNDTDASLTMLESFASTFTPAGNAFASGSLLQASGSGGLSVASVSGPQRFYTASLERMRLHNSGGVSIGNSVDPGQGLLSVSGFGASGFISSGVGAQDVAVRNVLAGTGNITRVLVGNDTSPLAGVFQVTASTYTGTGAILQNSAQLFGTQPGGLSLVASDVSGAVRVYSGGQTERMRIHASGAVSIGTVVDVGAGSLNVSGNATIAGTTRVGFLQLAGTTAAFPAWRNTGARMEAVLADQSNWASVAAQNYTSIGGGNQLADLTVLGATSLQSSVSIGGNLAVTGTVSATGGVRTVNVAIVGTAYSALAGDFVLASGTFNVTLPAPTLNTIVDVKNYGTGTITVVPSSGSIDGSGSYALVVQYQSVTLVADGGNWWVR
jgi:hypothetical protein